MKKQKSKPNKRSDSCPANVLLNGPVTSLSNDPELFEELMATWKPPCHLRQNYWSEEYQIRALPAGSRLALYICSHDTARDLYSFVAYLRRIPRLSCLSHKLMVLETLLEVVLHGGSMKESIKDIFNKAAYYRQVIESLEVQVTSASQYSPLYIVRRPICWMSKMIRSIVYKALVIYKNAHEKANKKTE